MRILMIRRDRSLFGTRDQAGHRARARGDPFQSRAAGLCGRPAADTGPAQRNPQQGLGNLRLRPRGSHRFHLLQAAGSRRPGNPLPRSAAPGHDQHRRHLRPGCLLGTDYGKLDSTTGQRLRQGQVGLRKAAPRGFRRPCDDLSAQPHFGARFSHDQSLEPQPLPRRPPAEGQGNPRYRRRPQPHDTGSRIWWRTIFSTNLPEHRQKRARHIITV